MTLKDPSHVIPSERLAFVQTLASNLFASSIIPYAGFLFYLQKSKRAPKLMMFGFYFLLVFVLATIIAGIYGEPFRSIEHCLVLHAMLATYNA